MGDAKIDTAKRLIRHHSLHKRVARNFIVS